MSLRIVRGLLFAVILAVVGMSGVMPAAAQDGAQVAPATRRAGPTVRVVGVVRDETNAISLPGIPVEAVGSNQIVYTDVDGRYILDLPPGAHEIKVSMPGYQDRLLKIDLGTERSVTKESNIPIAPGDTVTFWTAGGGGYGAPAKRDPQEIERDLQLGYISAVGAAQDYDWAAEQHEKATP